MPSATRDRQGTISPLTEAELGEVEQGIVRRCKIVGTFSRNKRIYPPEVLKASVSQYDGVPVNLDHRQSVETDVPVSNRFGRLTNPRIADDGSVIADLRFNPLHPYAPQFIWWVKNDPKAVAFSHFAHVDRERRQVNGEWVEVATSINRVISVDVVADSASTNGIYESEDISYMDPKPEEIGAKLATTDELQAFLSALIGASPLTPDEKLSVVENVLSGMQEPDPSTMESTMLIKTLGRRGKVGAYAAGKLHAALVAESQQAKKQAIDAIIAESKVENLPDAIRETLYQQTPDQAKITLSVVKESLSKVSQTQTPNKPKTEPTPVADVSKLVDSLWK